MEQRLGLIVQFLVQNDIRPERIVPCISREFLSDKAYDADDKYIKDLTWRINAIFKRLFDAGEERAGSAVSFASPTAGCDAGQTSCLGAFAFLGLGMAGGAELDSGKALAVFVAGNWLIWGVLFLGLAVYWFWRNHYFALACVGVDGGRRFNLCRWLADAIGRGSGGEIEPSLGLSLGLQSSAAAAGAGGEGQFHQNPVGVKGIKGNGHSDAAPNHIRLAGTQPAAAGREEVSRVGNGRENSRCPHFLEAEINIEQERKTIGEAVRFTREILLIDSHKRFHRERRHISQMHSLFLCFILNKIGIPASVVLVDYFEATRGALHYCVRTDSGIFADALPRVFSSYKGKKTGLVLYSGDEYYDLYSSNEKKAQQAFVKKYWLTPHKNLLLLRNGYFSAELANLIRIYQKKIQNFLTVHRPKKNNAAFTLTGRHVDILIKKILPHLDIVAMAERLSVEAHKDAWADLVEGSLRRLAGRGIPFCSTFNEGVPLAHLAAKGNMYWFKKNLSALEELAVRLYGANPERRINPHQTLTKGRGVITRFGVDPGKFKDSLEAASLIPLLLSRMRRKALIRKNEGEIINFIDAITQTCVSLDALRQSLIRGIEAVDSLGGEFQEGACPCEHYFTVNDPCAWGECFNENSKICPLSSAFSKGQAIRKIIIAICPSFDLEAASRLYSASFSNEGWDDRQMYDPDVYGERPDFGENSDSDHYKANGDGPQGAIPQTENAGDAEAEGIDAEKRE